MKKNALLMATTVLTVAAMLSACGSGSSSGTAAETTSAAESASEASQEDASETASEKAAEESAAYTIKAGTLMVGMEIGYPPMEYFDEDGATAIGYDVEVATALAEQMGLDLELVDTA